MSKVAKNFTDKSLWNAGNIAINNVNVATLGEINALLSGINYGSQDDLGKRIVIAEVDAADWSLSSVGTLYGGIYQLVHLDASATAANVGKGKAAFLLDGVSNAGAQIYDVTDEANAVALPHLCGVFLNSITPGNYGFIQVHGKYSCQYIAAVTAVTDGGSVVLAGDGSGEWDVPAAGNETFILLAQTIGNAITTPANGALGTVQGNWMRGRY
jgi:hypothetical protein